VIKAQFRLPPEQALALAVEDTPVYVAGGAVGLASLFLDKDKLVTAMRSNGALAWGDHHPSMFGGTERFFRPEYRAHLVPEWLPALEGVVPKLEAGAKVADVGCGHGASTVIMAQAFPASRFFGFDYHAPFIATAQQRAAEGGVTDRVTFAPPRLPVQRSRDRACRRDERPQPPAPGGLLPEAARNIAFGMLIRPAGE
jgi:SAM-dependent methyltransferase